MDETARLKRPEGEEDDVDWEDEDDLDEDDDLDDDDDDLDDDDEDLEDDLSDFDDDDDEDDDDEDEDPDLRAAPGVFRRNGAPSALRNPAAGVLGRFEAVSNGSRLIRLVVPISSVQTHEGSDPARCPR
jgi:hypothetical protein